MQSPINNRYDFVLLFDVQDGNPNGNPDAGNLPRVDPETNHGLVTDVCLKRKVRNYVGLVHNEQPPYEIYIKEKAVLNQHHERAYQAVGINSEDKKRKGGGEDVDKARAWMCQNFYDIRTFGGVMSTGVNCGQIRGPIQLTFARSIDPVIPIEHSITRMAVATEEEAKNQDGGNRTFGRKHTIPYGLYRCHGFISAHLAAQTGFNEQDLALFWDAIKNMFEHDRSAARGQMIVRGLYVFEHANQLGSAPAHELFNRITIKLKDSDSIARQFEDYQVQINEQGLAKEIKLQRIIG